MSIEENIQQATFRQRARRQELHLDGSQDKVAQAESHPMDEMLRKDRLPQIKLTSSDPEINAVVSGVNNIE